MTGISHRTADARQCNFRWAAGRWRKRGLRIAPSSIRTPRPADGRLTATIGWRHSTWPQRRQHVEQSGHLDHAPNENVRRTLSQSPNGGKDSFLRERVLDQAADGLGTRGLGKVRARSPGWILGSRWPLISFSRIAAYPHRDHDNRQYGAFRTIVQLIAATTTDAGLTVRAELHENRYPKGVTVSDAQIAAINLSRHSFHGDWNDTSAPRRKKSARSSELIDFIYGTSPNT